MNDEQFNEVRFDEFIALAMKEDIIGMTAMLDAGFDVKTKNESGETPFSYCCADNKLISTNFLVSRGADINTIDAGGGTPLHWAVCWSSPEFREWLISLGGQRNTDYEPWLWGERRRYVAR